jgi:NADPH-dependent curcumin reductase CurA
MIPWADPLTNAPTMTMTTPKTQREIHLASRPVGVPKPSDFRVAETAVPEPAPGQFLARNIYMSVDPYMRGRMRDVKSYVPPFQIGAVLDGGSIGQVVSSRHPGFAEGDFVVGGQGFREYYVSDGAGQRKVDPKLAPLSTYLGLLGGPGLTAYVGLIDLGQPKAGETLLVSAAAGAVGMAVGQIGKILGLRVVGSAGGADKARWLVEELGFDAAFDYRGADLEREIAKHCPQGVDIYFENVGGAMLEAALANMRPFGRIPLCGMIALYNEEQPQAGPRNLILAIPRRLTLRGFIISDHFDRLPDFVRDVSGWLAQGRIKNRETIVQGIENAPAAFIGLLKGENLGKMLVQIGPDPTR